MKDVLGIVAYFVGVPFYNLGVAAKRARWEAAASMLHIKLIESDLDSRKDPQRFITKCKSVSDDLRRERLDSKWREIAGVDTSREFEQFKDFIRVNLENFANEWTGQDVKPQANPHLPFYLPWPTP